MYSWWWVELSPETCRVKPLRRINAIVASCWIYFTISLGSVVQDFVVSLFDSSHGNRSCANCYLAKPLNNISFLRMAYYSGTFAWLLFLWQQQWFFRVLLRNNNLVWALCRCQPYNQHRKRCHGNAILLSLYIVALPSATKRKQVFV